MNTIIAFVLTAGVVASALTTTALMTLISPVLVALIGGWFVYNDKHKERKLEGPFKLIDDLESEISRLSTDLKELRAEQELCHKEKLEQALQIAELKIELANLKNELADMRVNQTDLRINQEAIAEHEHIDLPCPTCST